MSEGSAFPRSGPLKGIVTTARPKQWLKNLLVFAAPVAAGTVFDPSVLVLSGLAFVAFCLVASGIYFVNDIKDRDGDRAHPTKRTRPIAAGVISVQMAAAVGMALLVAGIAVAALLPDPKFMVLVIGYVILMINYSFWIKRIAVVDLTVVAMGFILRAIAGGLATGISVSTWFLIVTSFASLFIVASKRHAESLEMGEDRTRSRASLALMSLPFLRYVLSTSSAVTILGYCLWAFEVAGSRGHAFFFQLSIVPFVVAIMRYQFMVETGAGGAPEEMFLKSRTLQVLGLLWAAAFAAGLYSSR